MATQSVFEVAPKPAKPNSLLAKVSEPSVDSGYHIRYKKKLYLPTQAGQSISFTGKTKALVIEAFNGDIYLNIADTTYHTKELEKHEQHSKELDFPEEKQKERRQYLPPQSHPWKLASFKQYLHKIGKAYEDYEKEKLSQLQL